MDVLPQHDEMPNGVRFKRNQGIRSEGKQTVIASYWRVSSSHIKKSSRNVREWKVTQDLMFCPSAVVMGSFIKTSMTCSQTGGIEGGSGGVIKVGMLEGVLAGGVEASGGVGGGGGCAQRRVKAKGRFQIFLIRVRVGTLGRCRWGVNTVRPSAVGSHDGSRDKK